MADPRSRARSPCASALWVDGDGAHVPDGYPPPSVMVEPSPDRHHYYWRLREPVEPRESEALNKRLAFAINADRTDWDLTQLLRVPGTRNRKYPDAPFVRVLAQTGAQYDLSTFGPDLPSLPLLRYPVHQAVSDHTARAEVNSGFSPDRLSRLGRKVFEGLVYTRKPAGGVDRSASLVRLARVLFDAGADRDQIVTALAERDASLGWEKYSHRENTHQQYERIIGLFERGAPTRRQ